jgi:alkanesulfonate monooxygenase SsuD/methylene tetrahydromethanopterin reductase-like flavin-dependent oxidoreductase (luciferase family)
MERVGLAIAGGSSPNEMIDYARVAEAVGFESFWVSEGCGDSFALLGGIAGATSTIHLGTGIQGVFSRSPVTTALGAMTVDAISEGRFRLGLGVGHRETHTGRDDIEPARPLPFDRGQQRLRATAELVRAIVASGKTGAAVDVDGEVFRLADFHPLPAWEPYRESIPIYFAAVAERTKQLVGEIADGVLPIWVPPAGVADLVQLVTTGAHEADRDPAEIDLGCWIPTFVSDDRQAAVEAGRLEVNSYVRFRHYRNHFRRLGYEPVEDGTLGPLTSEDLNAVGAFTGRSDELAEWVAGYRSAGVTLPIISLSHRRGAADRIRNTIETVAAALA